MYGKLWESMYTGSMRGAGLGPFALMPYVVSNMKPVPVGETIEMRLEINPELLAFVLGTKVGVIEKAIEWACAPDPKSRTKLEGGRRLVKIGEFEYRVVNGWAYTQKKAIERRREQLRKAQAKHRSKKKAAKEVSNPPGTQLTESEKLQQKAKENDDHHTEQRLHEMRDGVAPGTYDSLYKKPDPPNDTPF